MHVLGINTSPRKESRTRLLLDEVLKGAENAGCTTTLLSIRDFDIGMCTGCETCYKTGKCAIYDDFEDMLNAMINADAIVIGSPNYIDNVTAQLKCLFDRMGDVIHRQRLLNKIGASVSTAGGEGAEFVAMYIKNVLQKMGTDIAGSVSYNLSGGEEAIKKANSDAYALGKKISDALRNNEPFEDQKAVHETIKVNMRYLVTARKEDWPATYEYWSKKGWL